MQSHQLRTACALVMAFGVFPACGDEESPSTGNTTCSVGTATGCRDDEVCEETTAGTPACYAPIYVKGKVTDAFDRSPVEGAQVVARDANGAAVSGTAETDAAGNYSLLIPVKRDEAGVPATGVSYTLRADASRYQSFPVAPRIALPIKTSEVVDGTLTTPATDISLIPLQDPSGLGTISGKIELEDVKGALVVAGGVTALAAADGTFTLFNVPVGDVTVTAYRQGVNLSSESVSVSADKVVADVVLTADSTETATVSGKVAIVNPGNGTDTSVILAVAETFVANVARGESPPGLRVANVSGAFTLEGVPDGDYVVLAAFENDFLVRDPDTCIGGTDIVRITVAGSNVTIDESFKITGALDVIAPDGEQTVTGTPVFEWADDSSEDNYAIEVYDALGTRVWSQANVPSVSGNKSVTVTYGGPALSPGMVYQFRATSSKGGCELSRTEDLRGVFKYE